MSIQEIQLITSATASTFFTAFLAYNLLFQRGALDNVVSKVTGASAFGFLLVALGNVCWLLTDPILCVTLLSLATFILYTTFWLFTCKYSE